MQLRKRSIGAGQTFYPFKRLPIELRYVIWGFVLEPRVVEASYHRNDVKDGAQAMDNDNDLSYRVSSNTPLPTMFKVCRESYNAVCHLYPVCFDSQGWPSTIKFNMSIDTLLLEHEIQGPATITAFLDRMSPIELERLQYLAIDPQLYHDGSQYWETEQDANEVRESFEALAVRLATLTGLKRITFIRNIMDTMEWFQGICRGDYALYTEFVSSLRGMLQFHAPEEPGFTHLLECFPKELNECATQLGQISGHTFPRFSDPRPLLSSFASSEQLTPKTRHAWGCWRPVGSIVNEISFSYTLSVVQCARRRHEEFAAKRLLAS